VTHHTAFHAKPLKNVWRNAHPDPAGGTSLSPLALWYKINLRDVSNFDAAFAGQQGEKFNI
jgi:hypothetical protein